MNYILHLVVFFDIYVLVALTLNLMIGYCGLLTLSHAGYFAIGAYTYSILSLVYGWSFIPAICAAMALNAILSLLLSLFLWRLRGDFFLLATLAVQMLAFTALYNWTSPGAMLGSLYNLTNGPFGISGIPRPNICGWIPESMVNMTVLVSAVTIFFALILWKIQQSAWGRLMLAIRDDELTVRNFGRDPKLVKAQAIAIASSIVAASGALYASYTRYIDPNSGSLDDSILMMSMVIIGGMGNFKGPVIGAATVIALPELLRFIQIPDSQAAAVRMLIYGGLLVIFMHFRPNGLLGTYKLE
jgi:branched-chain amino acid transport system permease protein